jgi:hypothetical protein
MSTENKKMGRPTNNPKPHKISTLLDDKTKNILDEYVKRKRVSQAEAIRISVAKLEEELK